MALVRTESGCKVGWDVYDNEQEAKEASKKAEEHGFAMMARGYDFGYCWPGDVEHFVDENGTDLWRVTVP